MEFKDVLNEYLYHCLAKGFTEKTMINKRQEFKHFSQFIEVKRGISELESITVHDLKSYIRLKKQSGMQPQSIVTIYKLINAFFNWCIDEEGYLKENPMKKVETPKVPKKVLKGFTVEEVQSMINAFSNNKDYIEVRNKALICMLADCGLRSIEIRTLKTTNVKDATILVNGKGNKERMVFISPILKKILIKYERMKKQYFEDKTIKSDNYFLSYTGDELSHVGLWNVVRLAGERAGIENKRVSPHSFRHFYSVQSLTNGGLDVYSLSRLLGHSDISITQRYLQSMEDAQLLDKAIASSPLMNLKRK